MASRIWLAVLAPMLAAVVVASAAEPEPLVTRVSPPDGDAAPRDVVVRAYIEPDRRNRSVEFVIDSDHLYSSSTAELDSDRAPRLKEARFPQMPAGHYEIRVRLIGAEGERAAIVHHIELW
jgi:hypothetical protein